MENKEELKKEKETETPKSKTMNLLGGLEKKKRDFLIELALFLILGFLVGIAAKSEAHERLTIGFDDYKMNMATSSYNIAQLESELIQKAQQEQEENADEEIQEEQVEGGAACGN